MPMPSGGSGQRPNPGLPQGTIHEPGPIPAPAPRRRGIRRVFAVLLVVLILVVVGVGAALITNHVSYTAAASNYDKAAAKVATAMRALERSSTALEKATESANTIHEAAFDLWEGATDGYVDADTKTAVRDASDEIIVLVDEVPAAQYVVIPKLSDRPATVGELNKATKELTETIDDIKDATEDQYAAAKALTAAAAETIEVGDKLVESISTVAHELLESASGETGATEAFKTVIDAIPADMSWERAVEYLPTIVKAAETAGLAPS